MGLFCPFEPAWGDIGTWVGAIGSLILGGAAVFIAIYANQISHRAVAAEAARTQSLRKALGALLYPELKAISLKLSATSRQLHDLAKDANGSGMRWILNQWRENSMPNCLATIQDLGAFPASTSELVGRTLGLVTTTFPEILSILDTQYGPDLQDSSGNVTYSQEMKSKFAGKIGEAATFARGLSLLANEAWECLLQGREPAVGFVEKTMRELASN
jgi:hypothetical protein